MGHGQDAHLENTMRKPREAVSVRVDAKSYKYLKLLAETNDWSITETIKVVCQTLEHMRPLGDIPTRRFELIEGSLS
jgi:hypothetical protein